MSPKNYKHLKYQKIIGFFLHFWNLLSLWPLKAKNCPFFVIFSRFCSYNRHYLLNFWYFNVLLLHIFNLHQIIFKMNTNMTRFWWISIFSITSIWRHINDVITSWWRHFWTWGPTFLDLWGHFPLEKTKVCPFTKQSDGYRGLRT